MRMGVRDVVRAVSRYYGLSPAEVVGPRRQKHLVRARQVAAYLAARQAGASSTAIGRALGDRDHSTIIHAWRRIERDLAGREGPTLRAEMAEIVAALPDLALPSLSSPPLAGEKEMGHASRGTRAVGCSCGTRARRLAPAEAAAIAAARRLVAAISAYRARLAEPGASGAGARRAYCNALAALARAVDALDAVAPASTPTTADEGDSHVRH